ncbi:MAG: ATP-binding protein [Pseudomonadota bacterium]
MTPPTYKTYSLSRVLLFTLLAAVSAIWGITAYKSYKKARHEVAELFDAELAQSSRVILSFVENSGAYGFPLDQWDQTHFLEELSSDIFGHKYEKKVAFQLWTLPDRLVLRSASAPVYPLSTATQGFSLATIDEHLWHVFTLPETHGNYIIHVGQRDDVRGKLTDNITRQLFKQFLLGAPLLGLSIWFIVGRSLRSLNTLAQEVKARKINRLAPIGARVIPKEVKPLVDALNALLARLEKAFENERRFTSDAAHELRTPLSGLKTQAQVALRAREGDSRENALRQILKGVEQMSRLVDQLLMLARVEQQPELTDSETVDLGRMATETISDIETHAHRKGIELSFDRRGQCKIEASRELLAILVRNLVENAIRYTPDGGSITVALTCGGGMARLLIEDSGPGIPEKQRSSVFDRFYRGVETANKAPGSGLGLSIVARIAEISGASVYLSDSSLGGLLVEVAFPLPKSTADKKPAVTYDWAQKYRIP